METKPRGRGCCGLSRQSYPHWPPTTIQESFDQLVYLHNKHDWHRRYLAHQWRLFVRAQASTRLPPALSNDVYEIDTSSQYEELSDEIYQTFECIEMDMNQNMSTARRPKGWSCSSYCTVMLSKTPKDVVFVFVGIIVMNVLRTADSERNGCIYDSRGYAS